MLVSGWAAAGTPQPSKEEFLTKIVIKSLGSWHYSPPKIDDAFSRKVYALQLKRMDPQKRFLVQEDIDTLVRFETDIDNELNQGTTTFFEASSTLLRRRMLEAQALTSAILEGPIDLNQDDSLPMDPEKQSWAKGKDELRQRWTRLLKYQILTHIQDVKETKEKEKDKGKSKDDAKEKAKDSPKVKDSSKSSDKAKSGALLVKAPTAEEQEKDAREYVKRSIRRLFERMLKEDKLEKVSSYLNTVGNSHDPHTEYFKPEAKEDFDLSMTGTLEGIGAVLREDDGYIKVVSIVPGSASWRQKELKAEDKILKVAQGADEPVDLVEASVNEAVRLIRGRKGTEVRLTVQKPSGRVQVIAITRDVVVVEETYAKSAIMTPAAGKKKIGYINLPAFYHDFNNSRGRTASADVRDELEKLKAENVDGIVLDLRNNGGGALDDAVKMAGLFFKNGPVVQIKDQKGNTTVLNDQDTDIAYDGPLVVMINTFSASASEIVAAALQDYGRAVILGTDTTFGKGTVQSMLDLDAYLPPAFASMRPMGSLKLTIQKFYRINGGTTQYKGVVPDILIPDAYSNLDVGEKNLDYPMPWDTVSSLSYGKWTKSKIDLPALKKKSQARLKADPFAQKLADLSERLQKQRDRTWLSLQKSKYFQEQETARKETEKFEAVQKENANLKVAPLALARPAADSLDEEKEKKWREGLAKDFYLREAVNVLGDMSATGTAAR
ncbi:MAG TPA: carboxy terminal-processing peptidase [Fibrobacteria bacterium]|nr:carboxy terminal-processing peptidase [Fibrobacteria bacterium]